MATNRVEAFSLTHAQIMDGATDFVTASNGFATTIAGLDIFGVNDSSISPDSDQFVNEGDDAELSYWYWLKGADVSVKAGYLSFPLIASMTGRTVNTTGPVAAVNEVQTITVTGATGGTFTLTFNGQTTSTIAYNALGSAVQTALEALSTIEVGEATVSGGAGGPFVVTFGGESAGVNVDMIVANGAALTGTTPAITVVQTTQGKPAQADSYDIDLWHEDSFNVPPKSMLIRMPSKDEDGVVRVATVGLYKVQFKPMTFDGPKYKEGLKVSYEGRCLLSLKDEKGVAFPDGKRRIGKLISHG